MSINIQCYKHCDIHDISQMFNTQTDLSDNCNDIVIISDSLHFTIGIEELLNKPSISRCLKLYQRANKGKEKNERYYLVDFPSDKFRFFLHKQWMAKFPYGSVIVLFPDRRMEALANYWLCHPSLNVEIRTVVCNSDISIISNCIEFALSGRGIYPGKKIKLTECEYITLKYLAYDEISIQKIASISQKNTKTIYTFKQNIESKFHSTIKKLLLSQPF